MSDRAITIARPSLQGLFGRSWHFLARTAPVEPGARGRLPDHAAMPHPNAPQPVGLGAMLRAAWHRHRTRTCLADLDAYLLKDIGVSFAEAEAEANKPFWVA